MSAKKKTEKGIYRMPFKIGESGLFDPLFFLLIITLIVAGCTKDDNLTGLQPDSLKAIGIDEIVPADQADSVVVNPVVSVTFKAGTDPIKLAATTITLRKENSCVAGKIKISGTSAIFTPETDLMPETEYTATIKTSEGGTNSSDTHEYSWRFRTGRQHQSGSLSVVTTDPLNEAILVPVSTLLTVTFNMELTSEMKASTVIVLKKGLETVEGSVSFTGNTAIFKPAANLAPRTIYSGRVKLGTSVKSADNKSGDSYYWTFTTLDTPALLSFASDVVPVLNLCNNCHTHPWTASSNTSEFYTNLANGGYLNASEPTTGKIYIRLSGGHPGSGISTADKNTILDWIKQGSDNN
jgi:hypothetical protein